MTHMRGRRNAGGCQCWDCGNGSPITRAQDKREAMKQIEDELQCRDCYGCWGYANCHCSCHDTQRDLHYGRRSTRGEA